MRKTVFILLLFAFHLSPFTLLQAEAKPVDPDAAALVARSTLCKEVVDITPVGFTHCYLFAGEDGKGFALVAADDCVRPLLAYSHSSSFQLPLPPHIAHWLNGYQLDIAALADAGVEASATVRDEWSRMMEGGKYHSVRDTAVGPLMTTQWNQAPYYNVLCPYSADASDYTVTGCVATATAQVMKYWNHPAVGRGSHTYGQAGFGTLSVDFDTACYDWNHMPDKLTSHSSDTQRYAVAKLMYHVGVAVEMTYGTNSSGAHVASGGDPDKSSSENALKNYFRYNQGLFSIAKVDYTDAEWDALLTAELDASRPVIVSGSNGSAGHAFVVDGYDQTGFFHLNWGWGGYCDGFYTLDSLNPSGSGIGGNSTNGYNQECKALLHVFPASENPAVTVSVASCDPAMGHVSGGGTRPSYTPVVLVATANEGYRFDSWQSGCHYNPFYLSPNNDITDTARFIPLSGDTLDYCYSNLKGFWGEYSGNVAEWGIRIPASCIAENRQLEKVQIFGVGGRAEYTMKVYRSSMPTQMVYTSTQVLDYGWNTITLATPIPLRDTTPLWIVFTSRTYANPATISNYSGNPDGTWYKRNGTQWDHLENRDDYASWMIRAITGPLAPVVLTVISGNEAYGTVSGGGSYLPGDTALLTATPAPGYHFVGWSTGSHENPLHYIVSQSETVVGSFAEGVAIGDVDTAPFSCTLDGLELTVDNPDGLPVALYDVTGRQLATTNVPIFNFHFSTPGVYLLRCGSSTRKINAL